MLTMKESFGAFSQIDPSCNSSALECFTLGQLHSLLIAKKKKKKKS